MMAWYIASVPFWIMTVFWLLSAIVAGPMRRPHESSDDIAGEIILSLIACGVTGIIAAWLVS